MKKRIIVLADKHKELSAQTVRKLLPCLKQIANVVLVDLERKADLERVRADLVITFGGDGAILSVAKRMGRNQMPVVGVNLGKLGFLAELSAEELRSSLADIAAGKSEPEDRMMLDCTLWLGRKKVGGSLGLNDAVISRGSFSRLVYVNMKISGENVTSYAGDGLIVATPVGSTAHSVSAGGPILEPDLDAFVVTPICAHTLSNRPIVVCPKETIELTINNRGQEVGLSIDGQVYFRISNDHLVRIVRAKERFWIYEIGAHGFYDKLRNKLGWGGILPYKV